MKRPPVVIGLAIGTVVAIVATLLLLVFNVSPGVDTNQREIRSQQVRLAVIVKTTHRAVCAQAQAFANSFRFRSFTRKGEVESVKHFLTRMQAQRQIVLLGLEAQCGNTPGFPPFKVQVRRALREIDEIFAHFNRSPKEPVSHPIEEPELNLGPFEGQIGDEGVPASEGGLKPIQPFVPPAVDDNGGKRGHSVPPAEEAPPAESNPAPAPPPPVPAGPSLPPPRPPKGQTVAEAAITIGEEPEACVAVAEASTCK